MPLEPDVEPVRTRRLDLITLTASVVDAVTAGDLGTASGQLGAEVGRWLAGDPSHLVQLHLAAQAAETAGFAGFARLIVPGRSAPRRVIGSIGFQGPPDATGRLEVGCRIHPAYRGRGWRGGHDLSPRLGDRPFRRDPLLLAVPSPSEAATLVPIEMSVVPSDAPGQGIDVLAKMLDGDRRRW